MQIIHIPASKKPLGKGIYGKYFHISQRKGIKILGRGYKRIEMLVIRSHHLDQAEKEVMILRKAEKSKISPRGARVIIAKHKGRYYAAIKMQHIHGKTLWQHNPDLDFTHYFVRRNGKVCLKTGCRLRSFVQQKLRKRGLFNRDWHLNNVMINKQGKVRIIDFSPDQIKTIVSY